MCTEDLRISSDIINWLLFNYNTGKDKVCIIDESALNRQETNLHAFHIQSKRDLVMNLWIERTPFLQAATSSSSMKITLEYKESIKKA